MLSRYAGQHRRPLGEADPPADDWSVPTILAMTFVQLGRRADACGDAIAAGFLTDLQFLIGPFGPINPTHRQYIAGLISERMGRPTETR